MKITAVQNIRKYTVTATTKPRQYKVVVSSAPKQTTITVAPLGKRGFRGYSAYELAVQNGFPGTEQDWLDLQKRTWLDYIVGAMASETIEENADYEIEKLTFPNNRFFYRKSTDTTDKIYADVACTILIVDRIQNL
jgi:hypothetical protein